MRFAERQKHAPAISLRLTPLFVLFLAASGGILFDHFLDAQPIALLTAFAACLTLGILAICTRRIRAATILVLLTVAMLFAIRHHFQWNLFPANHLALRITQPQGQATRLQAVVLQAPRTLPESDADVLQTIPSDVRTTMLVRAIRANSSDDWMDVSGTVRVTIEGVPDQVRAGDCVQITGVIRRIAPALNPGQMDFQKFYRQDRILCHLLVSHVQNVQVTQRRWGGFFALMDRTRNHFIRILHRHLDPQQATVAAAIILGQRESVDRSIIDQFMETGTLHVLAISGLHVGIVSGIFLLAATRKIIPFQSGTLAVVALVMAYALLTGSRSPVLRASILVAIVCSSWLTRLRAHSFNSLSAAALVILFHNPCDLFSPGAQLSFIAVGTLSAVAPFLFMGPPVDPLDRLIWKTRPLPVRMMRMVVHGMVRMLLASAAVWLTTLPIVAANFHIVSPLAIPLNLIIWLPVTVIMLAGGLTILLGLVLPPLAALPAVFCHWGVTALLSLTDDWHHSSGSHFWVAGPPAWWQIMFYGLGFGILCTQRKSAANVLSRLGFVATMIIPFAHGIYQQAVPRHEVQCTFVAVGHGSAVVVQFPDGQTLLYDSGRLGFPKPAVDAVSHVLWHRRIRHLDAVIVSHADADHYNAIPELAERFSMGIVYAPPHVLRDDSPGVTLLRSEITRHGISLKEMVAGSKLKIGGDVSASVLHPSRTELDGEDNINSVVLSVEYQGQRIILPGDLENPATTALTQAYPGHCQILMAPHHGSLSSSPDEILRWTTPQTVIISASEKENADQIVARYQSTGATALHLARTGAVAVRFHDNAYRIETFLPVAEGNSPTFDAKNDHSQSAKNFTQVE